ncbi:MAG: CRISPR-associated exonuclease, Cas4 family [Bacteroidota bacterium]|jgi:CRISPR-associated exonuclease Cas4
MRHITATLINYFKLCHRKVWLSAHNIEMEHTSEIVTEGRLVGEYTYPQRSEKYTEIAFDGIKIDFYDPKNKVVHEIKKSPKMEDAHVAQVKYYLFVLKRNGIENATGVIEYPKQRIKKEVFLSDDDEIEIQKWEIEIQHIIQQQNCPPVLKKTVCKSCSYADFCYADE